MWQVAAGRCGRSPSSGPRPSADPWPGPRREAPRPSSRGSWRPPRTPTTSPRCPASPWTCRSASPSGTATGMCWALIAIVSALTAIASICAGLELVVHVLGAGAVQLHEPLTVGDHVAGADRHLGLADDDPEKQRRQTPARRRWHERQSLHAASFDGPTIGPGPCVRSTRHFGVILLRTAGIVFRYRAIASRSCLREVLVPGGGALDDLAHQPAGHVAVRLVPGLEVVGDLVLGPL